MEEKIQSYLEQHYPDKPAFLFGSRVNGNYREDSDWDVGVIGTKKAITIDNIDFIPINEDNYDTNAVRNIFSTSVYPLVKKIKPLKNEEAVRKLEKRAKEHILQYTMQKSGNKTPTPEDIVTFYFLKKSVLDPYCKHKTVGFINSEDGLETVSEDYEKIISNFDPKFEYRYRDLNMMDALVGFIGENISKIRGVRRASKKGFHDYLKTLVKQGTVSLSRDNSDYEAVRALYHNK